MEFKECEEISAEFALHDAMDRILRYLSARDLCRAAQVCKTWNEAVQLELTKRPPERILVPDTYDSRLTNSDGPKFHLSDELRSKPELAIFLCGPRPHMRCNLRLEYDILTAYKPQLPHRVMIFGVDVAMMDEREIRSCTSSLQRESPANGILGLFLPKFRQLQIKVAFCESHEFKVEEKANRIVDLILPDDKDAKSTILFFGRSYYSTPKHVLSAIKEKFKRNSYTIWGGTLTDFLKTIDCRKDDYPTYTGMEGCIAISISGPSLERHSIVIDCNKKISEIEDELANFEKGLKLKRHSKGLVCGPRRSDQNCEDFDQDFSHLDLMQIVKKVFPKIPFTGFFNDTDVHFFGMDTGRDDADQELMHRMRMSILILTYN